MRAVAKPKPLGPAPPVMTATLSLSNMCCLLVNLEGDSEDKDGLAQTIKSQDQVKICHVAMQ
jgi:hypothetical protein